MIRLFAAILAAGVSAGAVGAAERPPVALVLDDASAASREAASAGVVALGGRVVHAFDGVLVVELPDGAEFRALRLAGVREVALNAVSMRSGRRSAVAWERAAWNAIARVHEVSGAGDRPLEAAWEADALVPPAVTLEAVRAAGLAARASNGGRRVVVDDPGGATARGPFGATDLNTSEFLAGAVSVNVILLESDGSIDIGSETWSADRENEVVARIAAGLEWVRIQEPQAKLRFVYHVFAGRVDARARSGYEPIRRPADPAGSTGEDLWVRAVLGNFGYATGDRFARSRAFAAETRRADATDWAVTVFVADSLNDTDGRFADGRFAYTWIGGPHLVMTYDNQAWGIARMDQVLRHELMHAFYAFDEYAQSSCVCSDHRGYLDGANANCTACNPTAGACVMIANGDAVCAATRRQIGWTDLDGDGVIDVVGEDPDTFLDAGDALTCSAPALAGTAAVVAATNRNPAGSTPKASISVNRIASVEVRADGAGWLPARAEDGAWGTPQERFRASFPSLAPGPHRLEARARDDYGNVDASPGAADVLVAPPLEALGDSVRASRSASGGASVTWGACGGAARYRVYRATSASGGWAAVAETTGTAWTDETAGPGFYLVRPVDACGTERTD